MRVVTKDEFEALWNAGPEVYSSREIARRLGVSKSMLHKLRRRFGLEPRVSAVPEKADVDVLLLFKLWHMPPSEMSTLEISKRLGVSCSYLYRMRTRHKLPDRERVYHHDADDPTEEEIAERAAAIRASWPEGEAEKRMVGGRSRRWSPPAYSFDGRQSSFVSSGIAIDFLAPQRDNL